MKVVTPEGYTFVTKFQEDNSHKVLRSVDFFSIIFDEIFFDTVCWDVSNDEGPSVCPTRETDADLLFTIHVDGCTIGFDELG